jgi:LmbE family N-acetylglucosaminyl deacetylase
VFAPHESQQATGCLEFKESAASHAQEGNVILSQVNEAEWLSSLGSLPPWEMPGGPILVIAPHPDDETLAVGGLIAAARQRGVDVTVAAVTDGEKAYLEPSAEAQKLGALRRREQEEALAQLGVAKAKIIRFGLPDSGLRSRQAGLAEWLTPLISRETNVIAPWRGDFHPDHEACGRAAASVAEQVGASLSFYFFWTWHRGTPELLEGLALRSFALENDLLEAKLSALDCHRSQLVREGGSPILPEAFLAPARRPFEILALA